MNRSGRSLVAKVLKEDLLVQINPVDWNGRCQVEHRVIQNRAVLPFRKKALSVKHSQLRVPQPDSGQIRAVLANAGH